ncbi:MAG TPA: tripartite tricarboxylate transporter substrate binding protein [Noviherbaspirillum sp.]|jgi:tripartite-type tricarboxylate transporter receptor subunit TctC|uniref:Bug family tripartite tricarboxylate transporter substrate binding protein n=1 Tax=Noviherbaspirillum sp. TaxID=1926288 RepID=UPI002F923C08
MTFNPTKRFKRAAAIALLSLPVLALADAYPSKPVKVIIPFPPGGPTDVLGRIVAQGLAAKLGQPFVVENKPGASGMIGATQVAKSPADGYTLLVNASLHVINPSLYPKMQHDPIKDFAPVSQIADVPMVLVVNKANPARNLKDVIAQAKANSLSFASSGNGTAPHLAGEAFNVAAGLKLMHVPYKGSAPALSDVMGGHVAMMFDPLASSTPFIQSGMLRPIAVTTAKRVPTLPDVPTMAEAGVPGYEISTWYGVWAPANTPKDIVAKLSGEIAKLVREPETAKRIAELGSIPVGSSPAEFEAYNRSEQVKFDKIVKQSGAKLD